MDALLSLLKEFDIATLLPEAAQFMDRLRLFLGVAVMIGPLTLLGLGAWYYFLPPGDPGSRLGFRTYGCAGNPKAWKYAQKLAGIGYGAVGAGLSVIMGILCLFFGLMEVGTVGACALVCVVIQLILTLAVRIGVQILVRKEYGQ